MIKIICAWCGKFLGEKPGEGGTTHGICDDCLLHNFPHQYERIKKALEIEKVEEIYSGGNKNSQ